MCAPHRQKYRRADRAKLNCNGENLIVRIDRRDGGGTPLSNRRATKQLRNRSGAVTYNVGFTNESDRFLQKLRLVPKQRSSGGRHRLFGISKRGDRYLRTLMIHGARAALGKAGGKQDPRSRWLASLRQRRHANVVAVALANKNARIVWAMLAGNVSYEPERSVQAA
jgi:transposase IS116/IS110/IS902 family protein